MAIKDIEDILSTTCMHGGNVKVFKDAKLFGKMNSLPNKPSMNGSQLAKLFKPSNLPTLDTHNVWRDIAMRNTSNNGIAKRDHMHKWASFKKLLPYFIGLSSIEMEKLSFKNLVY